jgi:hypothetical protein
VASLGVASLGASSVAAGCAGASAPGACASACVEQIDSNISAMVALDVRIIVMSSAFNSDDSSARDPAEFMAAAKVPISQ